VTFANTVNGKARPLAILIAVTAWVAVLLQLYLSIRLTQAQGGSLGRSLVVYFGYFTVLTNWLVCLAVTWPLLAPASGLGRFFVRPVVIGGVTASIVFVGVAYHVLLRHIWQPQGLYWVANALLHYATPILFTLYSVIMLRGANLRWTAPFWWSIYLLLYFVYALIRGALIGSYPYGFIDVSILGYTATVRNGCLLLVAFLMLGYVLMLVWRMTSGKRDASRSLG
jgi:hypothetical protein